MKSVMIVLFLPLLCISWLFATAVQAGNDYEIWCVGQCQTDYTPTSTTPGVVLMGGGVSVTMIFFFSYSHF